MEHLLDQKLFTIIKKCYQAKFWESFEDYQLLAVQMPKEKEPIFISIMGKHNDAYGYLIYRGYQQLASLYQAMNRMDEGLDTTNAFLHHCLAIYFENREDVPASDYQRIRSSEVKFRGRKAWPVLIDFKPGYKPVSPANDDTLWLIHFLEYFYETAKNFQDQLEIYRIPALRHFSGFPGRSYDLDGRFKDDLFIIPEAYRLGLNIESVGQFPLYVSQLEILRAKQAPQLPVIWELDFLQTTVPADTGEDGQKFDRPYFPIMLMITETESEKILAIDLIKLDDVEKFQRQVLRLFTILNTRPEKIYVKDKDDSAYIYSYLEDMLSKVNIPLHSQATLPVIDTIKSDIDHMIQENEDKQDSKE